MRKLFAFTLAEVLITLAIIGVVAALTLPTVIQNQQKRSLEVATQKFYSMMSQAVKHYMADYGVDDLRNTPLACNNYEDIVSPEAIESIRNFVTKYLKVVKECEANNCFAPKYKTWNNSEPEYNFTTFTFFGWVRDYVLQDGSIIRIGYYDENSPIDLYVDINGKKGPNRVGYDLWSMDIYWDGTVNESQQQPECKHRDCASTFEEKIDKRFEDCKGGYYGGCFGHFMQNGFKFDY